MGKVEDLLEAEAQAPEAAEADQESPIRRDVIIARGHDRSRTLQIRLNDAELAELTALAQGRGLPVSTVARQLLLQSLAPADDLKTALDRLERDLSAVRGKALSP